MVGVCRCVFECGVVALLEESPVGVTIMCFYYALLKYNFVDGFSRTPGGTRNNEQNMMHSVALTIFATFHPRAKLQVRMMAFCGNHD